MGLTGWSAGMLVSQGSALSEGGARLIYIPLHETRSVAMGDLKKLSRVRVGPRGVREKMRTGRKNKQTMQVVAGKRDLGPPLAAEWWWIRRRDLEKALLQGRRGATNKLRATRRPLIRRLDLQTVTKARETRGLRWDVSKRLPNGPNNIYLSQLCEKLCVCGWMKK